jgi:hypothetical protein
MPRARLGYVVSRLHAHFRTTIIFIMWPLLLMYCPAELNLGTPPLLLPSCPCTGQLHALLCRFVVAHLASLLLPVYRLARKHHEGKWQRNSWLVVRPPLHQHGLCTPSALICARVIPPQAMSCTNITWPNNSATRLFYRHHFYGFALLQGSVQVGASNLSPPVC